MRTQPSGNDDRRLREARTDRSNREVFHTGLWHFLVTQVVEPAQRLHRLRALNARMLERRLLDADKECGE